MHENVCDKFHIGAHITGKLSLEGSIYSVWDWQHLRGYAYVFGTLDWIGHVIIFIDIFMEGELFNIRNSLLLREIDGYVRMLLNRNTTFHKQNMICTYISGELSFYLQSSWTCVSYKETLSAFHSITTCLIHSMYPIVIATRLMIGQP